MVYDDEILQEINASVDLLEYVSTKMELTRKGKDYFGHCPLHVDKTPSFSITPDKNAYYCFSCGRSGGIIGYLIDYEHMQLVDAVKKAAQLADIDMSKMCMSATITQLRKAKAAIQKRESVTHAIFDKSLLDKYENEPAEEWIEEGIPADIQEYFGVRIDKWQNRIIYPVYDIDGNLINIKARTRYKNFKAMKIPKYINYYPIGTMDYFQGLNFTLPYIKESNEAIVFESMKSVMKAYSWGYKNVISAEKHVLTDEQIYLLVKLKCNVVFAYDCDISYSQPEVKRNIDKLKRITNVFVIEDKNGLLGGAHTKNAPVDLTKEIWQKLYASRVKIV